MESDQTTFSVSSASPSRDRGARRYKTRPIMSVGIPSRVRSDGEPPPSLLVFLSAALLVAAIPLADVKRDPGVAREPEYPLHLAKRDASGYKPRHLRPEYKRDITLPDVGQIETFPPTGIPQPIRGPYGDVRSGNTNEQIDRQNPDYVAPPMSDNGSPAPSPLVRAAHRAF
jgi:hypothetical protein